MMDPALAIQAAVSLGIIAAGCTWMISPLTSRLAKRTGAVDAPTGGRKIHDKIMPLWGGLGVAAAIVAGIGALAATGALDQLQLSVRSLIGIVAGISILLIGGLLDDRKPLSPAIQIFFPIAAALAAILGGVGIVQVTNPTGTGGLSLVWWQGFGLSLPSDILTFLWLLIATYSLKVLDGLDGLVAGLAVIGAGLVGALSLSPAYYQPGVGILSGIVGGAFAGFLPTNAHPAKQFLGESGSTIAGFLLGVLAILSSAKIAIALAVLAIPIADVALVIFGRIRRGVPWYRGDDSHLHFRLLKAGVPHKVAVWLYWAVALFAGVLALGLQTKGKYFLIVALIVLAAAASVIAGQRAAKRSV
jgi:UDP-GlcNAc:undecaprenyl-phosphate GlcNAc-1-phosphate transferase